MPSEVIVLFLTGRPITHLDIPGGGKTTRYGVGPEGFSGSTSEGTKGIQEKGEVLILDS